MNKYILIGVPLFCGVIIGTAVTLSIPKGHADTIELQTNPSQPSNTTVSSSPSTQAESPTITQTPVEQSTTEPIVVPTNAPQSQNSPSQPSPCGK